MRIVTTLIRQTVALVVRLVKLGLLAAFCVGIPYGLLTQIGSPIPRTVPSLDAIPHLLTTPVTDMLVLTLLADALWILWSAFTISVLAEVVAAIRGVPVPRLRPVAPMQALASWLVAGLTVGVVAGAPILATAVADPPPAAATIDTQHTTAVYDQMRHARTATVTVPAARSMAAPQREITVLVGTQRYTVTVVKGDNLSHLARDWLGDANRWPEIYRLNQGRYFPGVGGRLTNPNLIYPGWVLDLPADAHPPGTAAPDATTPAPSTPEQPAAPQPSTSQATPAAPTPAPSTSASGAPSPSASTSSADPDGVVPEPASSPSTSTEPSASPSSSSSPAAANGQHQRDDGVELPGGWITLPLAAALTTAAALVWLRRRHRWVPEPLDEEPDDRDLLPPPPVVTRIRRAVRAKNPRLLPRDEPPPPIAVPADRSAPPVSEPITLPPIGPSGADLAGLATGVPAGGLGLAGPGADAAARALLVATLSAGGPIDPDASGRVFIPIDALTTLLGTHAVDLTRIPRLTVTANLLDALTSVEEILIERRRTLLDYDANDLYEMRAADPYHPPMAPILLIAETPPVPLHARVASTLQLGSALQISGVLLGDWPRGETLTVATDGRRSGTGGQRLSVLDLAAAADLLGVLREAHTGEPPPTSRDQKPPAWTNVQPVTPEPAPTGGESVSETPTAAVGADTPPPAPDPAMPALQETTESAAQPDVPAPVPQPSSGLPVHVTVLGTPTILGPDGTPVLGLRKHARQLLVYLASHRPGADREKIFAEFWPTADPRRAAERLDTEVGDLRKHLRLAAGDEKIQPVVNPGGRYYLDPKIVTVDIWVMVDALREAANAAATPEVRIAALRRAVDAHAGVLSDGHNYDWIDPYRQRIRRDGIRARVGLAHLIAADDPHEAADLVHAAAELDPFSEDLARRDMRAQALLGNTEGVRERLDRIRATLDTINEEPTEETISLGTSLMRRQAGASG